MDRDKIKQAQGYTARIVSMGPNAVHRWEYARSCAEIAYKLLQEVIDERDGVARQDP